MKTIIPFDPKSVCGSANLDDSRMGLHVKQVSVEDLPAQPHGIVIIGFADETGIRNVGGRLGAKDGPTAAREKLYKFTTGKPRTPLYDLGNLVAQHTIEETHETGAKIIRRIHDAGHVPLVFGGGHDLAFAEALGLLEAKQKKMGFLNIDAHLDLRPVTQGITSGSPWFLLREHPLFQKLKCQILEFGIQSHCNAHVLVEYAKRNKILIRWFHELKNPAQDFQKSLKQLEKNIGIQVSLDIDSVNWAEAPGASAPQTMGFQAKEAIAMSRAAGAHAKVCSFGIYELSPALDSAGRTASLVAHCANAFLQAYGERRKRVKK